MDTRNTLEQAWRERDESRAQGGTGMQHRADTPNTAPKPPNDMRGIINGILAWAVVIFILMNLETVVTAIPSIVFALYVFWPVTLVIIAILLLVLVLRK